MNAYTVSLTALPTALAPPPVIVNPDNTPPGPRSTEQRRLDTRDDHLRHPGQQGDPRRERPGFTSWTNTEKKYPPRIPMITHQRIQKQRHQTRGQHPRGHQPLHRVDANTSIASISSRIVRDPNHHRRRAGTRHDQHRHQRTHLGHRNQTLPPPTEVRRAELPQQNVQRERHPTP